MIIELTGIPGSGKSTILKNLEENLISTEYIFDIKKYILGFNGHVIIYDFYLLFCFFRLSLVDIKLLISTIKLVSISENSFFHKVNIIRNNYKRIVINILLKDKNKIFFVDEGIIHIPFTIFVDVQKDIDIQVMESFIKNLNYKNELFIIDLEDNILLNRVIARGKEGHRRIDFSQKKSIEKFMQQSRIVLNEIKKRYEYKEYNNIGKIDIIKIKQLLGVE